MKVYIDVSNLMIVDFVTGIQRVVREVVVRMLEDKELEVVLLSCPRGQYYFDVLDNQKFLKYFTLGEGEKNEIFNGDACELESIEAGAVFFDIDSVWNAHMRRSSILPVMKNHGVKLAVFIHDIIPITFPQYCHENTAFFFMNYLAAYLQYADVIITSTQSTLDEINRLSDQLGVVRKKGYVSWLGADFAGKSAENEMVSEEARDVVKKGKYILCVGTIEPRKNHKLIVDAYDKKLADLGVNVVFAGKIGWNIEDLHKRIIEHPNYGNGLFHLSGQNDATIDYLYRNAYAVAFPTFEEGFGLPMIEAIERDCVLIASDIPVLREVGGRFCDYFNPYEPDEVANIIEDYLRKPEEYQAKKEKLKGYVPITWNQVSVKIGEALKELEYKITIAEPELKQMVILSARPDMLLETFPYIEKFMTFIQEVVVCCPDKVASILNQKYSGHLKLTLLTDSETLAGSVLPEDHTTRNFYLRCLAMKNDKLDNTFIMSDDDYRPLKHIDKSVYYKDGKYMGYYCFELESWIGTAWEPTSFDMGMKRTANFLQQNKYPCRHYASHMPQVIDKSIFLEMLQRHPGIENKGYCEWCTYFNYLQNFYPSIFQAKIYKSMCWPGSPTDWKMQVVPEELLFENYYEESYQKGAIFEGMSQLMTDNSSEENEQKIRLYTERQRRYQAYQDMFDIYSQMYIYEYREKPQIGVVLKTDGIQIVLPKYLILKKNGFVRIPFEIKADNDLKSYEGSLEISVFYSDCAGNTFYHAEVIKIPVSNIKFEFPLYGYRNSGNYYYNVQVKCGEETIKETIPVSVLE